MKTAVLVSAILFASSLLGKLVNSAILSTAININTVMLSTEGRK